MYLGVSTAVHNEMVSKKRVAKTKRYRDILINEKESSGISS